MEGKPRADNGRKNYRSNRDAELLSSGNVFYRAVINNLKIFNFFILRLDFVTFFFIFFFILSADCNK